MLQEDTNSTGDNFEIIDKRTDELSIAESLSSMSSSASLIPSPGVSVASVPSSGNLLSNVQPPIALPSFITQAPISSTQVTPAGSLGPSNTNAVSSKNFIKEEAKSVKTDGIKATKFEVPTPTNETFYPSKFSAAIPPSKGVKHGVEVADEATMDGQQVTDSGGFMDWMMKGAASSGAILSKVAEKAKSSVDSIITTLDPQMKEIICGDVEVLVASQQEVKISAVREAFQSVFGRAVVTGFKAQSTKIATQPVGFAAGVKAAEERIQTLLANPLLSTPLPVVAIENFLLEVGEDKWYDLGVLILNDPIRQINLQTFTQMTPVPAEIVALAQEDTPKDYSLRWSGLAVTVGSLMGRNLHVPHSEWHQALTGVSRREIILNAAKVLANLYKNSIGSS